MMDRILMGPVRSARHDMSEMYGSGTDEYVDDHTRAAILTRGKSYQPQGSSGTSRSLQKRTTCKLLLMAPSYDRSGTVGSGV